MSAFKVIARRELLKIASLNGLSVFLKIAVGLLTSKVISHVLGAPGMALTGNFRNFLTAVESFATLGFQNGIVKYSAEAQDEKAIRKLLSTVVFFLTITTVVLMGVLGLTAARWSALVFAGDEQFSFVMLALALCLPWYVASMLLVAVLNGFGKFRDVIRINIGGNLLGAFLSVLLIFRYEIDGALLAMVLAPALQFFITLFFIRGTIHYKQISIGAVCGSTATKLAEYSAMALTAAAGGAGVFLLIRNHVIDTAGAAEAGWWEGMLRISSYYMLFLSTLLAVYFLPNLSKAKNDQEVRSIYASYFQWVLPAFAFILVLLYFARPYLTLLLFSEEFVPMEDLYFWQFAGDFFKAASMILGYTFFARKLTSAFLITECLSLGVLTVTSFFMFERYGLRGLPMAYALTYLIYFLMLSAYFRQTIITSSRR